VSGRPKWLNRDPIGIAGGLNLYAYVGNNPISFVDPLGLDITVINGNATVYNARPGALTAYGQGFSPTASTAAMQSILAGNGTQVTVQYTDQNGVVHTVSPVVNDTGPWATDQNGHAIRPLEPNPNNDVDLTPAMMQALTGKSYNDVPVTIIIPSSLTITIDWRAANTPAQPADAPGGGSQKKANCPP
jgi:uncharacterized protein RhaS with RHS repeats